MNRPLRKPKESANIRVPRDVKPRKDLVEFTDEEGAKAPSQKRKRIRLNKGGMFFNSRDRQIVLLIAAHGWLDKRQICAFIGDVSTASIGHSLKRLVTHGLVNNRHTGMQGQNLYTSTAFGLRKVEADGFRTGVKPRMQTLEHTDAITAISTYFTQLKNPNVIFLTERELNAAAKSGSLSPRVLTAAPWTQDYENFQEWIPRTTTDTGKESFKRPDGYILTLRDGNAQLPIAVEVERTIKSRKGAYSDFAFLYATAAQKGHIAGNVIYFTPRKLMKELIRELETTYANGVWPTFLSKIKFEVNDLDAIFTPFSVEKGWIHAAPLVENT